MINFKSAFDCIHWPTLWKALETENIPDEIIRLLKATYHGSTSAVRIRAELSEEFTIKTGVRQRDVASPLLFNTVVDAVVREAFKGKRGVQFGLNNFLTDLMFADDSAVFADADAEATNILYNIAHITQSYSLKINADKTKVMTTDGSPANVYLEGIQIEQVEKIKYLGSHCCKKRK